jgi:hypothetical protein
MKPGQQQSIKHSLSLLRLLSAARLDVVPEVGAHAGCQSWKCHFLVFTHAHQARRHSHGEQQTKFIHPSWSGVVTEAVGIAGRDYAAIII